MILNGKALESFLDYLRNNKKASIEIGVLRLHWQEYPKEYLNALIINWFDSIGIYIGIEVYGSPELKIKYESIISNKSIDWYLQGQFSEIYLTRQEATTKAIDKANLIFNSYE